jgi:bifunctional non-homologous end joining protein LigD
VKERDVTFVKPKLVAQISFTEWTKDEKLRHPVYLGLRDDKQAREVRREG